MKFSRKEIGYYPQGLSLCREWYAHSTANGRSCCDGIKFNYSAREVRLRDKKTRIIKSVDVKNFDVKYLLDRSDGSKPSS